MVFEQSGCTGGFELFQLLLLILLPRNMYFLIWWMTDIRVKQNRHDLKVGILISEPNPLKGFYAINFVRNHLELGPWRWVWNRNSSCSRRDDQSRSPCLTIDFFFSIGAVCCAYIYTLSSRWNAESDMILDPWPPIWFCKARIIMAVPIKQAPV